MGKKIDVLCLDDVSITLTFFRPSRIMFMSCNCSKLTYGDISTLGMNQPK